MEPSLVSPKVTSPSLALIVMVKSMALEPSGSMENFMTRWSEQTRSFLALSQSLLEWIVSAAIFRPVCLIVPVSLPICQKLMPLTSPWVYQRASWCG